MDDQQILSNLYLIQRGRWRRTAVCWVDWVVDDRACDKTRNWVSVCHISGQEVRRGVNLPRGATGPTPAAVEWVSGVKCEHRSWLTAVLQCKQRHCPPSDGHPVRHSSSAVADASGPFLRNGIVAKSKFHRLRAVHKRNENDLANCVASVFGDDSVGSHFGHWWPQHCSEPRGQFPYVLGDFSKYLYYQQPVHFM